MTALLQFRSLNYTSIQLKLCKYERTDAVDLIITLQMQAEQLSIFADEPLKNSRKIQSENYTNKGPQTRKNKYCQDIIMILQISADKKEFTLAADCC